jgi:hypothetical protein
MKRNLNQKHEHPRILALIVLCIFSLLFMSYYLVSPYPNKNTEQTQQKDISPLEKESEKKSENTLLLGRIVSHSKNETGFDYKLDIAELSSGECLQINKTFLPSSFDCLSLPLESSYESTYDESLPAENNEVTQETPQNSNKPKIIKSFFALESLLSQKLSLSPVTSEITFVSNKIYLFSLRDNIITSFELIN